MTWFFASKDLRTRLLWLRRIVPIAVFVFVLLYQLFSLLLLRDVSELLHIISNVVAYGVLGPVTVWFTITWILQRVDEHNAALEAKANAERERQRALEKAREQERLLATICSNSADAIVSLANDGTVLTWNRGAEMIFGYKADEVIGKHYRLIVPDDLQARGEVEWLADHMKEHGYIQH